MFTIENGSEVKSNISGFSGMVTSRAEHLHGCNRYWVQPPIGKDKKLSDGAWFDEQELVVIKRPKAKKAYKDPGGFPSRIK